MAVGIRVLGSIDVVRDGISTSAGGTIAKKILSVLVARRGLTVSSDRLVDDVWRESAKGSTRHTLQAHVSNLRKVLGRDAIIGEGGGYRLELGQVQLDAEDFERRSARGVDRLRLGDLDGADQQLSRALDLWRGTPYTDVEHLDAIQDEIDRLAELHVHASENRARARAGLDPIAAIPELTRLFDRHPDRESIAAVLMRTLYQTGRQAEALDVYQQLREHLVESRGIDPSPALQELELAILNQDPGLDEHVGTIQTNMARAQVNLVGRDVLVQDTVEALRNGENVVLTGPGGIGKSSVARAAASRMLNEFGGGVWWVDLEAVTEPELGKQSIAAAMRIEGDGDINAALDRRLNGAPTLLVIDGADTDRNLSPVSADWLWDQRATVLATARQPLPVRSGITLDVPALSLPRRTEADPSGPDERRAEFVTSTAAVELFIERAAAAVPGVDLSTDPALLADVVATTNGVPLEIELTAARLRTTPLAELRSGSIRDLDALVDGPGLVPDDRTTLVLLSGIPGAFGLDVARCLVGDNAAAALTRLEDAAALHLIHSVGAQAQYRLIDSVRIGCAGHLEREPLRGQFADRIIQWGRTAPTAPSTAVVTENPAFRTAISLALQAGRADDALAILARIGPAWIRHAGGLGESLVWLRRATETTSLRSLDAAEVWLLRSKAEMRSGAYATAISSATETVQISREREAPLLLAQALIERGHASQFTPTDLTADMHAGRTLADDLGNDLLVARADVLIAQSELLAAGATGTEDVRLERAAVTFQAHGDLAAAAHAIAMRAAIAQLAGDLDAATDLADEAMDLSEEGDDRSIEILCLYRRASVQSSAGRTARAARTARRGLRTALEVGHRPFVAALLLVVAQCQLDLGEHDPAHRTYRAQRAIIAELGLTDNALDAAFHVDTLAAQFDTDPSPKRVPRIVDGFEIARSLAT